MQKINTENSEVALHLDSEWRIRKGGARRYAVGKYVGYGPWKFQYLCLQEIN